MPFLSNGILEEKKEYSLISSAEHRDSDRNIKYTEFKTSDTYK